MNSSLFMPSCRRFAIRRLLPLLMGTAFVVVIGIGERQIRSSPKWPPPRHELGAWQIDNPPVLNWAVGLNLPATIPILWMWAHNDAFAYALDDHNLIVYFPWILFAYCLWYFVGYRLDQLVSGQAWKSPRERYVVLCVQAFITLELLYAAGVMRPISATQSERTAIVCFGMWLVLVVLGWADFILKKDAAKRPGNAR
jgi:hypothetical protein